MSASCRVGCPQSAFRKKSGTWKQRNIFYEQVFDYIDKYKKTPVSKTTLEFNWLYYNTATNKMIMRIIMFLKKANSDFEIAWYYNEGFEMIMEKGKEIEDILGISIDIKQV